MYDLVIRGGRVIDGTGAAAFMADIAVADGRIVELGKVTGSARREIDAGGLIVTPGWVDIHTHYDGQVTWDPWLEASFVTGVTTAIFGNCGVGFAPVRQRDRETLIEFMEGVEEIPADALHAGLKWNWETFPEYLDAVAAMDRSFDVGALVPHGPLRLWALGDRVDSVKCATGDELAQMALQLERGLQAGAFGMATSRTPLHRSLAGATTPDYNVQEAELQALAAVVQRHGGYLQIVPEGCIGESPEGIRREMAMLERIVEATGVNVHLLSFQCANDPDYFREQIAIMDRLGEKVRAFTQFGGRSPGALISFLGANPFMNTPSFEAMTAAMPPEAWLAELAGPEMKAQILGEENRANTLGELLAGAFDRMFDLGADLDYEPGPERCLAERAVREGRDARDLTYDRLLESGGSPAVFATFVNYAEGNLDAVGDALRAPSAILAASDAGAHILTVCDGSVYSFMLTHWVRDRTRGPRLPIELAVHLMTQKPAEAIGLTDRGVLAVGRKADINVIDLDALTIHPPYFKADMPGKARRLAQDVTGYRATVVSGRVTRENDRATGELPGRLIRSQFS